MRYILSLLLLFIMADSFAQNQSSARRRAAQKKDTLRVLSCPLNDAVEPPPPKLAYGYGKQEGSVTLTSASDTMVKACTDATVSKIQQDAEGKWEVVLFYNDYWFWYSGVSKVLVKRNQVLKSGDTIGIIQPGQEMELLLYDFETPIDPKKYLDCKKAVSR